MEVKNRPKQGSQLIIDKETKVVQWIVFSRNDGGTTGHSHAKKECRYRLGSFHKI